MWLRALLLGMMILAHPSFSQDYADIAKDVDFPARAAELEAMRSEGNLDAQRNHLWELFGGLTRPVGPAMQPVFLTWYGADEVFAVSSGSSPVAERGPLQSFSFPHPKEAAHSGSSAAPLIVRAHYNLAAYRHIRDNGLEDAGRLLAAANSAERSAGDSGVHSVPDFPRDAIVVKSVWWPVPDDGIVAFPVWDPASNPPRATGNDYLTWSRVVGVSARPGFGADGAEVDVDFVGRSYKRVRAVGIDALYHLTLDQRMAQSFMADPEIRRVAGLVLGRPLHANDRLALVAMHMATRELSQWIWGTFWWHDRPDQGPYAPPRQPHVPKPWRNYLMSVSFDADLPREADGSPHVAFNPWLEGRFPDNGHGGGVVSNCVTCHRRASTPRDKPFLVTRGTEAPVSWAPPQRGVVTTSSLWSLPLQAH